jgi:cyclophilin family peptidyl-prolyl cis-trans isomerase
MAQHKAPTSVTIASLEDKSAFAQAVDRYWKVAVLLALALTAGILYSQRSKLTSEAANDQSWEKLMEKVTRDPRTGAMIGNPSDLLGVADQIKGSQAGPWALYMAATLASSQGKYEEAQKYVAQLRQEYPTHSLVVDKLVSDPASPKMSLVEQLSTRIDAQVAWRVKNPTLFQNPELPADAPKVKINTDKGTIVVGLYKDLAPKHVENFLKLSREGFYTGVKFHRVVPGFMIQSGDPNTIQGAVETWGLGGPAEKLDPEPNNLKHFTGYLAAAKASGDPKSSGSQFYITVADRHDLDGNYVVFGKVLEGMNVVRAIEQLKLVAGTERPEQPPTIQSTEVQ